MKVNGSSPEHFPLHVEVSLSITLNTELAPQAKVNVSNLVLPQTWLMSGK